MKTSKKRLLFLLLILITGAVKAQSTDQDVVYLKNGGIIRGSIIEMIPDKYVKIETFGQNVFVYPVNEIEKCVKEPRKASIVQAQTSEITGENSDLRSADTNTAKHGYFGTFEFGMGITGGYMSGPLRTKLSIINGYRFNPYIAAGMGIGFRMYPGEDIFMPLFADLRLNFINKRVSPYLSFDAGYAFCLSDVNNRGLLLSPTLGVSMKLKGRKAINLGFSYELQRSRVQYYYYLDDYYNYYYPYPPSNYRESSHTVSFLFGFSF